MPKLDRPQDVVHRLRGHWRRSLNDPLWGRSAIVAMNRLLDDEDEARLPHRAPWCLGPDSFRQLIESLSESAQIVSLDSALQLHHDPRPRIALTFDGGWRDVATQAMPVLEHLALPASAFLPTAACRTPWMPASAVIGEALWHGVSHAALETLTAARNLPLPPPLPDRRDERVSQTIADYLQRLHAHDGDLEPVADALWEEDALWEARGSSCQLLDAFSIRRWDQSGLLRFGHLSTPTQLATSAQARRQLHESRARLQRLCREPLTPLACTEDTIPERLDRFVGVGEPPRWLTRQPGWLEPPSSTATILPRFVLSQPLASSPGRLFDWLLGHLSD